MNLLSIVLVVGTLGTLGFCLLLMSWYKNLLREQEELKGELEALKNKQIRSDKSMELALRELKQMNQLLQSSLSQSTIETPLPDSAPSVVNATLKEFYMAIPNQDGSFHTQAYSETFKPRVSLYRFKEFAKGRAEFEFYSDDGGLKDALNFSSAYLAPACMEMNDIRPDTQRVITVEKGEATLSDLRWVILRKAKIRYA